MTKKAALLLCVTLFFGACGDDSPGGPPDASAMVDGSAADGMSADAGPTLDDNMRRLVLASVGRDVVFATYGSFHDATEGLLAAVTAWSGSQTDESYMAARTAWQNAMNVWQLAEVMQFGPAAPMEAGSGGRDLRDEIYSWTTISRCRVDQEVVEMAFGDVEAFRAEGVNVRGLDALEYLLFHNGSENACSSASTINRSGSWAAISEMDLQSRRAAYAVTLATLVRDSATVLRDAWDPSSGNFLGELETAGTGSETFASGQEGLNGMSDALFYLDKETKDMKIAIPAALTMDCSASSCPAEVESDIAHFSLENIRQNVVGFQAVYRGQLLEDGDPVADDKGFRGLLLMMGADALVNDMDMAISGAFAAFDNVDGTLAEAVVNDRDDVVALYNAVKAITDLLKTSFVGTLDLELPARAEGDND